MRNATSTQPITALCLLVGFIILAAGISIGRASGLIGSGWFLLGLFAAEAAVIALVFALAKKPSSSCQKM